ncbi:phosphopantetheine-binding protein [Streptomyces kanasensis]|uniref:phosphopantetheine-binding protein n=1 Tax=Streptomyces kanasensis TaxID=936756 RepID=UPI0036FE2B89
MPLTYDSLVPILADVTGVSEDEISPQTTLLDVEMDALLLVELAVVLAERHGVHLADDRNLTPSTTIADFVRCLTERGCLAGAVPSVLDAS